MFIKRIPTLVALALLVTGSAGQSLMTPEVEDLGPGCGFPNDPVLSVSLPVERAPFTVRVESDFPNTPGLLTISNPVPSTNVFGCELYVGLEHAGTFSFTTDANGDWSLTFPDVVPAAFLGTELHLQAGLAPAGVIFTNGLRVKFGERAARLRALHASPDAPNVDVLVNGSPALQDVPYKTGSGFIDLPPGSASVEVQGLTPSGNTTVIGPVNGALGANDDVTVIAVDTVANIRPLVIANVREPVARGSTRVQVVHTAPSAPPVDVYATAPGASLAGATPLGSFGFTGDLGPVTVPSGDTRVRVTLPSQPNQVVFDSGTITLPSSGDLLIAAVDDTTASTSPISLVVLDGSGSNEILDPSTQAATRVVHASPDAPPVDVVLDDDFTNPVVTGLAYSQDTPFVGLAPGLRNVKVTASGTTNAVIDANVPFAAGSESTILAVNNLASIEALVLSDDRRPVATEAKLRIVHGSPSAGPVDVYLTAPGVPLGSATPVLTNVPFKASSGYLSVAAGNYDVTVTPAGSTTAAIGPLSVNLVNGEVYTAIARDAAGGGLPLGLITLDDF